MTSTSARRHHLPHHWLRRTVLLGALAWGHAAFGQLTWSPTGPGGTGGSGTWDTTNTNWWDGTNNVVWNSGTAVFGGTGGTVSAVFPGPKATGLTFNTPGYTLKDGWITVSGTTFTVTTNADATISSTMSDSSPSSTLVKNGAGVLTVSGTNFISGLLVNEGEYRVGGTSSLFFSNVTLADNPGATVTLAQTSSSTSIGSISGGGVIRPDATARTVSLTIFGPGTYHGSLQDNGSGRLAVEAFGSPLTLQGANTYSGATEATATTLTFNGNGSAVNTSSVTVTQTAILRLDNSTTALGNRISDTAEINLFAGRLELLGHATTAVEEQLGTLKFSGAATVYAQKGGTADTLLTFSGAARQGHSTLNLTGTGRTKWTGLANNATGIIAPYVTVDNEWAAAGSDGRAEAFTGYVSTFAGANAHTKLTAATGSVATSTADAATLNWQNNTGSDGVFDVGAGHTITLAEGGLLSSGTKANRLDHGTIRSGTAELVVINQNDLTVNSVIGETVTGTGLTKSGGGTLTLGASNTYSGTTTINQGVLAIATEASLGTASTIELNGGTLRTVQSFTSTKGITSLPGTRGSIDTAGNNVTFSGANTGSITKSGAGTLTLSNAAIGSVSVSGGTLILTNSTSGDASLFSGTLQARGRLSNLVVAGNATLDIGGSEAATLALGSFNPSAGVGILTVRFGLGLTAAASDLLTASSTIVVSGAAQNSILFDFQDLGGAQTGTDYTLISANLIGSPSPFFTPFAFSPASTAAGWKGTISTGASGVTVNFTAVPEPGVSTLLGLAGLVGTGFRRRRGMKAAKAL